MNECFLSACGVPESGLWAQRGLGLNGFDYLPVKTLIVFA